MKRRIYLISAVLSVLLSAISCIKDDQYDQEYELKTGETIPDFAVTMNDGSTVTSAALKEGVAVIMFFHTGCPDCRNTLPSVQRIYEEYSSEGVKFVLISREEEDDSIRRHWDENGYTLPYSAQTDRSVYSLFASSRVPRVYVCKDGTVTAAYHDSPIPSYEDLVSDLESVI